jgi:hypothetical protein
VSALISVQLDVLAGLLAELRALGAELAEEQRLTLAVTATLDAALGSYRATDLGLAGEMGSRAGRIGTRAVPR